MTAFETYLADPSQEKVFLLEIDAFALAPDTDGTGFTGAFSESAFSEATFDEADAAASAGSLYYSSHGYISGASDAPASTYYEHRVSGEMMIERRIFGRESIAGLTRTDAEIELINADGGLDTLQASFALDGRPVRILVGRMSDARAAFTLIFSGVVQSVDDANPSFMRLKLSDGIIKLSRVINPNTYGGTGALEGGSDIAGKYKPLAWGNVQNVPAVLVDAASLIYQVNDGAISDVSNVYDRQVALGKGADYVSQADMQANPPAGGQYRVWKAGGFFRLGSTPAGTCTADVLGDASGRGYVNKAGDILQRVLLLGGIDASLTDAAAFAQMNIDQAAEQGVWCGPEGREIAEVAEQILESCGAFGGFTRMNLFTAAVLKAPIAPAAGTYTEQDIMSIRRLPLPADIEPAVWRARVAWGRNYTVMTDVAAAVLAARRTFAAQSERVASASDLTVKSQRQLSRDYGPVGDVFAQQADAQTEANRRLALWKNAGLYEVEMSPVALARDLGDEINLTYGRLGFNAGKEARVIAHRIGRGGATTLTVIA
jgi:hypothetical protein